MKRIVIVLLLIAAVSMLIYQFVWNKTNDSSAVDTSKPVELEAHSGPFIQSYDSLLNAYYSLKEALVNSDVSQANVAAQAVKIAADSLNLNALEGDSTGIIKETARNFTGTISNSSAALVQESGIEDKRREFEIITDALYTLTRAVRYDGGTVYYQFCPMAFNDKGAYWLSSSPEIRNPYFGDKMLTCGSIQDSIKY